MNLMINQFHDTLKKVMENDNRVISLLGSSGVVFFPDLQEMYPDRFVDAGIMEQSIISMCAGLAIEGFIPVFYGQSPFIVERAYEQLKVDFGYQGLGGNFIGYGASTENAVFGATHCCPADLAVLSMIPNMEIVIPSRPEEYDSLFKQAYDDGHPTFFRITRYSNSYSEPVSFGRANVVKKGKKATIVAFGPMLELAMTALGDEDITILYYTTLCPFDSKTLLQNIVNERLMIFEPAYKGGTMPIISQHLAGKKMKIDYVGYPLVYVENHGFVLDNAKLYGLDVFSVRKKYIELLM